MHLQELDAHRRVIRTRSGEISYIDIGTGPVAHVGGGPGPGAEAVPVVIRHAE